MIQEILVKVAGDTFLVKIQPEGDLLKLGAPVFRSVPGTRDRMIVSSRGTVLRRRKNRNYYEYIKPCRNNCGYLQVSVPWETGTRTSLVHRLVALTFLPAPQEGETDIDHQDLNKENNSVSNLRWTTHKVNCRNVEKSGIKSAWKNIKTYNPVTGEVAKYPDITTALTRIFPEGIPSGSRSRVAQCIRTGGKAYNLYWSSMD